MLQQQGGSFEALPASQETAGVGGDLQASSLEAVANDAGITAPLPSAEATGNVAGEHRSLDAHSSRDDVLLIRSDDSRHQSLDAHLLSAASAEHSGG